MENKKSEEKYRYDLNFEHIEGFGAFALTLEWEDMAPVSALSTRRRAVMNTSGSYIRFIIENCLDKNQAWSSCVKFSRHTPGKGEFKNGDLNISRYAVRYRDNGDDSSFMVERLLIGRGFSWEKRGPLFWREGVTPEFVAAWKSFKTEANGEESKNKVIPLEYVPLAIPLFEGPTAKDDITTFCAKMTDYSSVVNEDVSANLSKYSRVKCAIDTNNEPLDYIIPLEIGMERFLSYMELGIMKKEDWEDYREAVLSNPNDQLHASIRRELGPRSLLACDFNRANPFSGNCEDLDILAEDCNSDIRVGVSKIRLWAGRELGLERKRYYGEMLTTEWLAKHGHFFGVLALKLRDERMYFNCNETLDKLVGDTGKNLESKIWRGGVMFRASDKFKALIDKSKQDKSKLFVDLIRNGGVLKQISDGDYYDILYNFGINISGVEEPYFGAYSIVSSAAPVLSPIAHKFTPDLEARAFRYKLAFDYATTLFSRLHNIRLYHGHNISDYYYTEMSDIYTIFLAHCLISFQIEEDARDPSLCSPAYQRKVVKDAISVADKTGIIDDGSHVATVAGQKEICILDLHVKYVSHILMELEEYSQSAFKEVWIIKIPWCCKNQALVLSAYIETLGLGYTFIGARRHSLLHSVSIIVGPASFFPHTSSEKLKIYELLEYDPMEEADLRPTVLRDALEYENIDRTLHVPSDYRYYQLSYKHPGFLEPAVSRHMRDDLALQNAMIGFPLANPIANS